MAENKSAPDPFWPAEKVQAVADKLYRDMAPVMCGLFGKLTTTTPATTPT